MIRLQCYEGLDENKRFMNGNMASDCSTQVLKEKLGDLMDGAKTLDQSAQRLEDFKGCIFLR